MKGNISLNEFIKDVKDELKNAINNEEPFFVLDDVELEVTFALNASAQGAGKLVVVDISGSVQAAQTHKVKLKLTPFVEEKPTVETKRFQQPKKSTQPKLLNRQKTQQNRPVMEKTYVGSGGNSKGSPQYSRSSPTMKK